MKKCLVFGLALLLSSCFSTYKVVDENYTPKGNKIAVVSGLHEKLNFTYASKFEQRLAACSTYTIVPQATIKKIVGTYPIKIKGPYRASFMELNEDYNYTDVATLMQIGRKLKVNYIYAIWIPTTVATDEKIYESHVITQMFEVSTGKEIGHGTHKLTWIKGMYLGWGAARNENDSMDKMAGYVSKELAEKMGVLKK